MGEERRRALVALVEACKVAYILAKRTGRTDLATAAARRGVDAARLATLPGPTEADTGAAEARGMLHLTTALLAAREGPAGEVNTHPMVHAAL